MTMPVSQPLRTSREEQTSYREVLMAKNEGDLARVGRQRSATTSRTATTNEPERESDPSLSDALAFRVDRLKADVVELARGSGHYIGQCVLLAQANRALLAERDDLIDSLREMVGLYDGVSDMVSAGVRAKVERARAAIAKAAK